MTEKAITFFLVRHGESECNVQFIPDCLPNEGNYPLTPKGKKQIERIAKDLKKNKIDTLYSSPMRRTRETAEIISQAVGVPVRYDERLREMDFGVFKGRPMREFWDRYPDPKMRITPYPEDKLESIIEMRGRLKTFLDDIQEKCRGKKVVLVSHGDPLEQLHGIFMNESPGEAAIGWYPKKGHCVEIIWKG